MSDTPKTDAKAFDITTGNPDADGVVMADFARELERELTVANNWVEHHQNHCDDLIKENAALRDALNNAIMLLRRWNKNDVTDDVVIETRKAIYAGRKEAQP